MKRLDINYTHAVPAAPAPEATREATLTPEQRAAICHDIRQRSPVGLTLAERWCLAYEATVAAQAREIETLRADKARLDWLEREHPRVGLGEDGVTRLFARDCYGDMLAEAPTFREAIDAALAARAPEPQP